MLSLTETSVMQGTAILTPELTHTNTTYTGAQRNKHSSLLRRVKLLRGGALHCGVLKNDSYVKWIIRGRTKGHSINTCIINECLFVSGRRISCAKARRLAMNSPTNKRKTKSSREVMYLLLFPILPCAATFPFNLSS